MIAFFTEPILRPSFPPFSIYRFLPDYNRNEILSRSNCAQVESVAIIIGAKRDGLPSSSNNVITTLQNIKRASLHSKRLHLECKEALIALQRRSF